MHDVVIRGGLVVDGSGKPGRRTDVAIDGEKISRIGNVESRGHVDIDASKSVVSPGFIDIHSHSDRVLWMDPEAHSKVRQGVTLEVVGNCGSSATYATSDRDGFEKGSWPSIADYFGALEEQGVAVNVMALVGHGSVRANVMGYDRRPPTARELQIMKRLVIQAMEQGAVGLSTGLVYTPGCFAETDEIIELCRPVHAAGGFHATHLRGEGDTLVDAVEEAIYISRETGIPLQISHHKCMGKHNWGRVSDTLAMIETANDTDSDVTVDAYAYTAGSTGMISLLPPWIHDGGRKHLLKRLEDASIRDRLRTQMVEGLPGWSGRLNGTGWENVMVVSYTPDQSFEGMMVSEIAHKLHADPFDTAFDMLISADGNVQMCIFATCEQDVEMVMKSPFSMIGSDGRALRADGALSRGKPHPRSYGNFPRVLAEYWRRRRIFGLETAVHKMTGMPAERLGLSDRGLLREGAYADIVVFSPELVRDTATFSNPHQYPEGILHVVVNGTITVVDGNHTGHLGGKVLRKT